MTVKEAARELRAELKYSQQTMASTLGISMAALRNYESGAVANPDARAALAYLQAAQTCGRADLAGAFESKFGEAIGGAHARFCCPHCGQEILATAIRDGS